MGQLVNMVDEFNDLMERMRQARYVTTNYTFAANLARTLVSNLLGGELESNKSQTYSMRNPETRERIVIKGVSEGTGETGIISGFYGSDTTPQPFEWMAIVVFDKDYRVDEAVMLPYEVVAKPGVARKATREGSEIGLGRAFWEKVAPQGVDIKEPLKKVFYKI